MGWQRAREPAINWHLTRSPFFHIRRMKGGSILGLDERQEGWENLSDCFINKVLLETSYSHTRIRSLERLSGSLFQVLLEMLGIPSSVKQGVGWRLQHCKPCLGERACLGTRSAYTSCAPSRRGFVFPWQTWLGLTQLRVASDSRASGQQMPLRSCIVTSWSGEDNTLCCLRGLSAW